jgi:methyl-accepting chemotaxis protein
MKNLSIKSKLALLTLCVTVIVGLLGYMGLNGVSRVNASAVEIRENYLASIVNLSASTKHLYSYAVAEKNHIIAPNDEVMLALEESMDKSLAAAKHSLAAFEETLDAGEETELFNRFKRQLEVYLQIHDQVITLSRDNNDEEATLISGGQGYEAFAAVEKTIEEMLQNNIQGADEAGLAAQSLNDSLFKTLLTIIMTSLVLIIALCVGLGRSIIKPIGMAIALAESIRSGNLSERLQIDSDNEIGRLARSLNQMADGLQEKARLAGSIAEGNLTEKVVLSSDKDELGKALEQMRQGLNEIVSQIQGSSYQITSGADQVSASGQSLSQGSTELASSLEEISSSMVELGAQTTTNADNATQANQLVAQVREAGERGAGQMQDMVGAMVEINDASQSIAKIIKVIDEIAFQTNLLALNAAVEAARAGQHGKGFAVVAEEVRNLAARSAKAAQETATLIEGAVSKASNGAQIAERTSGALDEIVSGVGKVNDLVGEIDAASREQAQGINQVNQALGQVDNFTQRSTANAEESAAAAEELAGQAATLQHLVARFQIDGQSLVEPVAHGQTAQAGDHSWAMLPMA